MYKTYCMKTLLGAFFLLISYCSLAQSADEKAIRDILDQQTRAWNEGKLEQFMSGYWENDSLMFIGSRGVTYGWANTLRNYKQGYPDTAAMGKLQFNLLSVKQLSPDYFFVVGKWKLYRTIGDLQGHYTLVFRKINGQWKIVADHSS